MQHRRTVQTLIALAAATTAFGDDLPASGPLGLADVVAYARAHNPELEGARHRATA